MGSKSSRTVEESHNVPNPILQQDTRSKVKYLFIIAAHHGRIVCFLNRLAFLSQEPSIFRDKNKALQNLAVMKFSVVPLDDMKCSVAATLLFPGIKNDEKVSKKHYEYLTEFHQSFLLPVSSLFGDKPPTDPIVFYMIRHGRGEHNVLSSTQKLWRAVSSPVYDPLLVTKEGIDDAARAIHRDLTTYPQADTIHLVSSPLRRCIETLALMYPVFQDHDKIVKEIIILSCLHEFTASVKKRYAQTGQCDHDSNRLQPSGRWNALNAQNTSMCIRNTDKCTTFQDTFGLSRQHRNVKVKQTLRSLTKFIPIVWTFFNRSIDCKIILFPQLLMQILKKQTAQRSSTPPAQC